MASPNSKNGTEIERLIGMLAVGIFTTCYYYSTLYPVYCIYRIYSKSGFDILNCILILPVFLSLILPAKQSPKLLSTYFFKCALKYHDYEEVNEFTDEEYEKASQTKNFIFATQPHGVLSVAGICYGISKAPKSIPPTAVASILLRIPIMKHVFGTFNLIDASKKSLTEALKRQSVVIYIGGMAELFLSSLTEEKLFVRQRKGFIKLAMQTNADVVPCYFFGNTSTLEVIKNKVLMNISRTIGVSITLFWGRWGSPFTLPRKVLVVRGRPIGVPYSANPSNEEIDLWHEKYVSEVERIYNQYKVRVPEYKNKCLVFDQPNEKKQK
mmetsp:Transcript_12418/g.18637  ORF Transcript_12418/g.18637 Transcript_12418/m.18637 type:complete len:325 (-) Transcript_12418:17-991(-)